MPNYNYPNYQFYQGYPNYQNEQNQNQVQNMQNQVPQIQNGGIMHVRNMQEAFNYPVAPGTSVTFKDETAPRVYVKTRSFSQMEQPIFDVYELKKIEEATQERNYSHSEEKTENPIDLSDYALKIDTDEIRKSEDDIRKEIDSLEKEIDSLKEEIDSLKEEIKDFNKDEPIVEKKTTRARK